jgi:hypothetical protein
MDRLNKQNAYLCLNTAALLKERILKEQDELRKLEAQRRTRR